MSDDNKLQYYPWLLLLLATSVLFYPTLNFEYLNFDDQLYIVNDPAVKQLSLENLKTIFLKPYATAWYPLTRLSHALEFTVFGNNAIGTHVVNVGLHFLNAAILFLVLLHLGRLAVPKTYSANIIQHIALFLCLLFVVHPQHIETVAWAVQRKELLATLFALLSMKMYLENRRFAVGVFFTLAMLSKTSIVMLPILFIGLDLALLRPKNVGLREIALALWANRWLILLAVVLALLTILHHQAQGALFYDDQFSPITKLLLYADNSLHGLYRFFTLQAEMFHLPVSKYVTSANLLSIALLAVLVILLITLGALFLIGPLRVRIAAVGLVFYFIALLPVGGLVVFGNFAFGDRYLYFSSIGIYFFAFICLTELFSRLPKQRVRPLMYFALGLVFLAAIIQSQSILPKWASTETIWKHDVEQRPDSVFANEQLGQHYLLTGRPELAFTHFKAVINSESEPFKTAARTSSALYMAEILCGVDRENQAIQILKRIPEFGGDIRDIELLTGSLHHTGYDSCAQAIEKWYRTIRP